MLKKAMLLFLVLALGSMPAASAGAQRVETAPRAKEKPNIVFILADDMRYDDLEYMPKTRGLLGNQGMHFENAFVSLSMCCPSRATIMRGQYAHNTGVWTNDKNSPIGGWKAYREHGNEKDNVATRLRDAGYRTGLFGKYFNGYTADSPVPRGWDDWFATDTSKYYDFDVNDNGTVRHYGRQANDYNTDVLREETEDFIDASIASDEPFFAYVAPKAPHTSPSGVATPAARDRHEYDKERGPRLPSFNERDVSDKPRWIGARPPLTADDVARINWRHQNRAESLQAVDDLVSQVVNRLDDNNVLHNTYIFFTSDNGWQSGEHRIPEGKRQPYEESIHVPLLVRGPGVTAGSSTDKLALNTDYLPTFTELARAETPRYVDGRSLMPVLAGDASPWRTAALLETRFPNNAMSLYGIRTHDGEKYLVYGGGFRELYDLTTDPHELVNAFDQDKPPTELMARLRDLKDCARDSCRAAEDGK